MRGKEREKWKAGKEGVVERERATVGWRKLGVKEGLGRDEMKRGDGMQQVGKGNRVAEH